MPTRCAPGSGGHLSTPHAGLREALALSGEQEGGRREKSSWTVGPGVPGCGATPPPSCTLVTLEACHEGLPGWVKGDRGPETRNSGSQAEG